MKPTTPSNLKSIGSYRAQTQVKPEEDAKTRATTPLGRSVPRRNLNNNYLGAARRERGAEPFLMLRDEQNRQDLTLSPPTAENEVADQQDYESSSSEAVSAPNIIRIPDDLRTSDTAINETLTGSEVIGESAFIEASDHSNPPENPSEESLTGSEPSSSEVHLYENTASPVAEAGGSAPGSINVPKKRQALSKRKVMADLTLDPVLGGLIPKRQPRPLRKAAQILPPLQSREKKTTSVKFKSPGALINGAREIVATRKAEYAKRTNLQAVLNNLPAGINLDEDGNLSGTSVITHLPRKFREGTSNGHPGREGMNYQDFLNVRYNETLAGKTTKIAGYDLVIQAVSDLYRLNFEFVGEHKVFRSVDIESKNQAVREAKVVENLAELAGTPAATFVLSSVLQQGLITGLTTSLSNNKGVSVASHLRLVNQNTTTNINRQVTLFNEDGTREVLQNPRGMGTAEFKLSRNENNDFKLSVDWQAYYDLQRDNEGNLVEGLPLGENDVIGVHFQVELIINKPEADKGRIQVATDGISATFSGRLQMN